MSTVAAAPTTAALELIDVGENTRELDPAHVEALAASIALRGLIVPLVVRPDGERFTLIAGHHRYAACRSLGLSEVEVTLREQEGIERRQRRRERRAQAALAAGGGARGQAHARRGLHPRRRRDGPRLEPQARQRPREDPRAARDRAAAARQRRAARRARSRRCEKIAAVSPELCEAALGADRRRARSSGEQLASNPGWAIGHALRESATQGASPPI